MAKSRTLKPVTKSGGRPPRRFPAFALNAAGLLVFIGGLAAITVFAKGYVDQRIAAPNGPLNVVIKDKPPWMSDFLAEQIAATVPRTASSAFDRELLVTAADKLRQNPWVCSVRRVRRMYGERPGDTLEIDCDFRAPIALVRWGQYFWLVDGEGVKLPELFTSAHVSKIVLGRDGRMNIRIIEGVRQPPPETGQKWQGRNLAAGLAMAQLLYGKPFAEEIVSINVANFDGRQDARESQLVLRTKYATEVRWGRPLDSEDSFAEVPASQKLGDLKAVMQQYGRVDAGQPWIDVRFDKITYPSPVAPQDAAARLDGAK